MMIVLLDLEWINREEKHLTQLAALRTGDGWETEDSLELLANPGKVCLREPEDASLGGSGRRYFPHAFFHWMPPRYGNFPKAVI